MMNKFYFANGKCKLIVQNRNFMTKKDVEECLLDLKIKKCEGYDRIPVCSLYDARVPLLPHMALLFDKMTIAVLMVFPPKFV